MHPSRRHFLTNRTLEYFVVIAIVVLITAASIVLIRAALVEARDARRVGDIATIRLALELYYTDHAAYPAVGWAHSNAPSWDALGATLAPYLPEIPRDPTNAPGGTVERTGDYTYAYYSIDTPGAVGGRDDYVIIFRLENPKRALLYQKTEDLVNWRGAAAFANLPDVEGLYVVRAP